MQKDPRAGVPRREVIITFEADVAHYRGVFHLLSYTHTPGESAFAYRSIGPVIPMSQ